MKEQNSLVKAEQWRRLNELRYRIIRVFLDLRILSMLRNVPYISGYDIVTHVHKNYGVLVSPGTCYSTLYSMERKGFVKGYWKGGRRIYSISAKGKEYIQSALVNRGFIINLVASLLDRDATSISVSESEFG